MTKPCELTASRARKLIGQKKLSSVELTKSCLDRIEKINPKIFSNIIIIDDSLLYIDNKNKLLILN